MHLNVEDIRYVKEAADNVLAEALDASDLAAVVSTSGKVNSGLTRDKAKLREAINSLSYNARETRITDCPRLDYYQADLIVNGDTFAEEDAINQVKDCDPLETNRAELRRLADQAAQTVVEAGNQDIQATFYAISVLIRVMANMPGLRTLVMVSSGFSTGDPSALLAESEVMNLAAQSNITINTLDARGLFTSNLSARDRTHRGSLVAQEELHTGAMNDVENVMASLANSTGGTFFHNSNDLSTGFKDLAEAPATVYLIELSLDGVKRNGAYHRLKVKVDRDNAEIRTRPGYYVPPPGKK